MKAWSGRFRLLPLLLLTGWPLLPCAEEEGTVEVVRTFVITLHQATERQATLTRHLARWQLPPVELLLATNLTDVGGQGRKRIVDELGMSPRAFELGWHRSHPTVFAACVSHRRVWERVAVLGAGSWAFVLEDDARVVNHPLGADLRRLHGVPADADVLMLGRHQHLANPFAPSCGGGLAHAYAISAEGARKSIEVLRGRTSDAVDVQWPQYFRGFEYATAGALPTCLRGWSDEHPPSHLRDRYARLGLPLSTVGQRMIAAYHPAARTFGQITEQAESESTEVLLDPLPTQHRASFHGDTDSLLLQGERLLQQPDQADAAAAAFARALRNDKLNPLTHGNLALALVAQAEQASDPKPQLQRAVEHLARAAELNPTLAFVHFNLGVVHARLGDLARARAALELTMAVEPTWPDLDKPLTVLHSCQGAGAGKPGRVTLAECTTMLGYDWRLAMPWDDHVWPKRRGMLYAYNTHPKPGDQTATGQPVFHAAVSADDVR